MRRQPSLSPVRLPDHTLLVGGAAVAVMLAAYAVAISGSPFALAAFGALAALPYVFAIRRLERVLLAVAAADVLLQWDINFGYQSGAGSLGAEGGLSVSITTFAVAGLYAIWAARSLRPHGDAAPLALAPARPLLVYVGICALSIATASSPALGGFYLALLVQTLLLFVYIVSMVRRQEDVVFVVAALVAAVLLESILMLGVQATGASFHLMGLQTGDPAAAAQQGYAGRASGTLGSPISAGSALGLLLPAALGLLLAPVARPVKGLAIAALAFGLPALLLTGSRGAAGCFLLSCVILAVIAIRAQLIRPRHTLAAALALLVLALPLASGVIGRVSSEGESTRARATLVKLAWEIIQDRPLLGVGLNNVASRFEDYAGPQFSGEWLFTIHNKYLLVASEAGIAALLAFLWFLATTVARGLRCLRSPEPVIIALAGGLLAGFVGNLLHMTVDIFASRAQVQGLWLIAALLAALAAIASRQTPDPGVEAVNRLGNA